MNGHDEPPVPSPELATLLRVGGSLVAAGFAARRRAARKSSGAIEGSRELLVTH
jgi:hypothetical protein